MGKMVGAAEFKAKCLAILEEVQATGTSVTVTKRGKPYAVVKPVPSANDGGGRSAIGFLKSDRYRFDIDPGTPAADPEEWAALR